MFDTPVVLVFVPQASLSALQACAVPVLRRHHHDDVLPDLPEGTELLPQYTLQRPAADWSCDGAALAADAVDGFLGQQQHDGLVITASRCSRQLISHAGVVAINSSSNRFPWHPACQHIAARGCSVGAAQLREAAARGRSHLMQQQHHQQHTSTQLQWWPTPLVPVALPNEQQLLQDMAAAITMHNTQLLQQHLELQQTGIEMVGQRKQQQQQLPALIVPLLVETVQRTAAAVAVQAAWRSYSCRQQQDVANRLLFNRAATAIQRAWHAYVLRSRLAMLAAAAEAYRHAHTQLRFSCIMCLDVAAVGLMEAAAQRCRDSSSLFPEHRLWFAIEPEGGDLFLIDAASCSSSGSSADVPDTEPGGSSGTASIIRDGLPAWVGAETPVIPAECSAAADAVSRAHLAKLLQDCCSVKDLLDPAQIQAGACSRHDVAQLVTFRSKQQAAQRAALLAAYTYDMRSGAYAKLMTVQESPLGAAYRNLTSLSTTGPSGSTNKAPTAAAAAPAPAPAVVPAGSSASRGGSKAAAGRLQSGAGAAVAGQGDKIGNKAQALSNSLPAPEQAAAPVQPSGAPAAAEVQPPHEAAAVQQWPPAPCSTKSSPRMLGYAVPLQPIHPTATLAAAAEANSTAAPGSAGADVSGSSSSSTLQLYVSVLTRFPFLVRELAAEELWEQDHDALDLEAVERWAHTKSSARTAVRAAAGAAEAAGSGSWAEGSRSESRDGPAVDACCVVSHPPCTLMGRPDVKSLGAYLERTKLQQVAAFKGQLSSTSQAAAAAAAAESCARQEAVEAAKALSSQTSQDDDCKPPVLLNTSSISTPHYWPDTTTGATAAAQAFRQLAGALAAARCAALRDLQQQAAWGAAQRHQERREAASAATKAEFAATKRKLRQEQQHQQAASQHRAATLRHVRTAAPATRHKQRQQVAAFATDCNKLSKYLHNDMVRRAKAVGQLAAAQHAQQQRQGEDEAAAALEQLKQEKLCAAQESVLALKLQLGAELEAVRGVQGLEAAARRAAAAARLHERSAAVWTGRQAQQQEEQAVNTAI